MDNGIVGQRGGEEGEEESHTVVLVRRELG